MSDRDEEDETHVAVKHPLFAAYPADPRSAPAPGPYPDDPIPDEDETLVALDRRAVPFDPRAMGRALPAIPTPPRPAAGMPATLPPPSVLPPPRPAGPTPVPDGFMPIARTLTMPQADPRVTAPLPAVQAFQGGPASGASPSATALQAAPHPPAAQGEFELAGGDGMPPF